MTYKNFKSLADFKQHFRNDLQYLASLNSVEIMQHIDQLETNITNWVYNFCSVETFDNNYINLFWTSEKGKTYNLIKSFKEFTDFYNQLMDLKNMHNIFCNLINDFADENWKF